jgi:SAM-dependent methyltransferase
MGSSPADRAAGSGAEPTYRFAPATVCNMCGADAGDARFLGRRLDGTQGLRPARRRGVTVSIVRCARCGLVFPDPMPHPSALEEHYEMAPEEYWEAGYFADGGDLFTEQIARFRRQWTGDRVPVALDVGAGIGKCMRELGAAGFDVFGLEPSAPFRTAAIERTGIAAERISGASMESAEYAAGAFDLITFGAVLEHLFDPAAAVERALTWLAPGGLVHAEVPSARFFGSRVANAVYRLQGLDFVGNLSPMHRPFHLYEFTRASFERHGERAGYRLVEAVAHAGAETYLPGPQGLIRGLMRRTGGELQLEVWLGR